VDMEPRLARVSDIDGLFKFRPYHAEHRDRVKDILLNDRVYFSVAATFNDPFDPRPCFRVKSIDQVVARMREWMDKNPAACPTLEEREARLADLASKTPQQLEAILQTHNDQVRTRYPMYCLSANRGDILQWSHYANGHQGLCVHFDNRSDPFGRAREVDYESEYPTIEWPMGTEKDKNIALRRALLTKSTQWKYEREYRLIKFPPDAPVEESHLGLHWHGNVAEIPPQSIVGVTVGAAMGLADQHEIVAICRGRPHPVPVYRARLHPKTYSLAFEQIA
jgi:Protein of unknown function (DUF2971)